MDSHPTPSVAAVPTFRNAARIWRWDKASLPDMSPVVDQRVQLTHTAEAGGREGPFTKRVGALTSVWMRSTGSGPMASTKNSLQRGVDESNQHNGIRSPRQ